MHIFNTVISLSTRLVGSAEPKSARFYNVRLTNRAATEPWAKHSHPADRAVTKNGYTKHNIEPIRNDVEVTSIGVWFTDQGIYPLPWDFGYRFGC